VGYSSLVFRPDSKLFPLAKATGLTVSDWQNMIFVNQNGQRFWNEVDGSYRFFSAAWPTTATRPSSMAAVRSGPSSMPMRRRARNGDPKPPYVDPDGYFCSADTDRRIGAQDQESASEETISGAVLQETVNRYNSFVAPHRHGFQETHPAVQDREAAILRRLGDPLLHDTPLTGLRSRHNGESSTSAGR